jgi:ABC-2 type transport system permease protein
MTDASLAPRPGAAPVSRMLRRQAATELVLTLRRGESVLLTLVIPLALLATFVLLPIVAAGDVGTGTAARAGFFVPGVVALAVMSTAFTGQAIATGYERHYGALKLLGATPLPRWALLAAKTAAVCAVELLQVALLLALGLGLGWRPHGSAAAVVGLAVLGTAAFSGLGLLMAGTLPAEVTLAAANLAWFALLVLGGVLFPLSYFGATAARVLQALPTAALTDALRAVLRDGTAPPAHDLVTLAGWAVGALAAAAALFRWE